MDDGDGAEVEELRRDSWLLRADDDSGAEMALQSYCCEELRGEGLGLGRVIHELKAKVRTSIVSRRFLLTLCASSKAITRRPAVSWSRKILKQMLNSEQAPSGVTQGHERSTIVREPG